MITKNFEKAPATYYGLSSDTKPDGVENGSTFLEMDTGKVYIYDAANETWREL